MTLLLSRRDFLGYSATAGGALLLAGCGPNDAPAAATGSDQAPVAPGRKARAKK